MLSCTEQGLWPDNLSDVLSESELDALIEHAEGCPYHQYLLDEDEEEFLAELHQTTSLLCTDPFASLKVEESKEAKSHNSQSMPMKMVATPYTPVSAGDVDDPLYGQYRSWSDDGCPLEIIQVRCDERIVCTFDLLRDGGSWRLSVKAGDAPLQFWTLCRRHQDKVLLAVYPIPRQASERSEASTLFFANGQSLSVLAEAKGGNVFDVWVHCTAPWSVGAKYVEYNFDALTDQLSLEATGVKYYKTSQLLDDLVKLEEFRFPVPDMEAARFFEDLPKEKYTPEWVGAYTSEENRESEPVKFPLLVPDQQEPVVALLKKWADGCAAWYVCGSLKKVTIIKRQFFHIDMSRASACDWRAEHPTHSALPDARNGVILLLGAGNIPEIERPLNFVFLNSSVDYELEVMSFIRRVKTTPVSEVCQRIKAYHSHFTWHRSKNRQFVPLHASSYEQTLLEHAWPGRLKGAVNPHRWAFFGVALRTLFEKFLVGFLGNETSRHSLVCSWGEITQPLKERMFATVGLDRVCRSCALRDLRFTCPIDRLELIFRTNGDHSGKGWAQLSISNRPVVTPSTASLLMTAAYSQESYEKVT